MGKSLNAPQHNESENKLATIKRLLCCFIITQGWNESRHHRLNQHALMLGTFYSLETFSFYVFGCDCNLTLILPELMLNSGFHCTENPWWCATSHWQILQVENPGGAAGSFPCLWHCWTHKPNVCDIMRNVFFSLADKTKREIIPLAYLLNAHC